MLKRWASIPRTSMKVANPATPDMAHLLGKEGDYGKDLKLDNKWAYNIIKQVGNYSEIFERNVGSESPLKIKRGKIISGITAVFSNDTARALSRCEVTSVATAALSSALCFPRFDDSLPLSPLKAHSLLPTLTVRAWLFQILAVVAVVGIVGWLFHNTVTNLNNRGITSGFAFLDRGAGFWYRPAFDRLPAGRHLRTRFYCRLTQYATGFCIVYCVRFCFGLLYRSGETFG